MSKIDRIQQTFDSLTRQVSQGLVQNFKSFAEVTTGELDVLERVAAELGVVKPDRRQPSPIDDQALHQVMLPVAEVFVVAYLTSWAEGARQRTVKVRLADAPRTLGKRFADTMEERTGLSAAQLALAKRVAVNLLWQAPELQRPVDLDIDGELFRFHSAGDEMEIGFVGPADV